MSAEVIRPSVYIVGILCVILVVTFTTFLTLFSFAGNLFEFTMEGWTKGWFSEILFVFFWPLIFSIISALIMQGTSRWFNKKELTLIIVMVGASWILPTQFGIGPLIPMLGIARQVPAFHKWWFEYGVEGNWMFGPDPFNDKLWESFLYGGPVPWSEWMPAIIVQLFRVIPFYLSFVFLAALWRRQWVEIEGLPFPYATAIAKLIDMAYERTNHRPEIFRNIFLWLGVFIGFIGIFPFWAPILIPGIGLQRLNYPTDLGIDLTPLSLIPWAPLNFHVEPFWIGALFLIPIKTLFSLIVTAFIMKFLFPLVMVYSGIWDPMPAGFPSANLGYTIDLWWGGTGPLGSMWANFWGAPNWFSFGAVIALIFFPLFIHKDETIKIIKTIFRRSLSEIEEREPLKYRYLLIGYITCIIIYSIAWWYVSLGNLNLIPAIIWTICVGLYYGIGVARAAAEMGLPVAVHPINYGHLFNYHMKLWWFADPSSPFFIRDLKTRYLVVRGDLFYCGEVVGGNPCPFTLEGFKIASMTGLHSRHIFFGITIAVVVGVITTWFAFLQFFYHYGALHLKEYAYTGSMSAHPMRGPTYACISEVGNYWRSIPQPKATHYIQAVIGGVTILVIFLLEARFPWFPLNPAGVTMGSGWAFVYPIFFPAVVAYVAKMVIIKIGGTKIYEEKAEPFAIGLVVALSLAIVITNLYLSTLPR